MGLLLIPKLTLTTIDSNLYSYKGVQVVFIKDKRQHKEGMGTYRNLALHLCSDKKNLKDGDWVFSDIPQDTEANRVWIYDEGDYLSDLDYKLEASTDLTLKLPQIPEEFLRYVALKNGKVTGVEAFIEPKDCICKAQQDKCIPHLCMKDGLNFGFELKDNTLQLQIIPERDPIEIQRDKLARAFAMIEKDAVRPPKWPAELSAKEWIAQGGDIQAQVQWDIYDNYLAGFDAALAIKK